MLTDDDKHWITERLEKVETTLLTAFHKWASPVEMRQRTHTAALRAIDVEMESLADRMSKMSDAAAMLAKKRWKSIPKDERAALMPKSTSRPRKYPVRCPRYPQHHFSKLTGRLSLWIRTTSDCGALVPYRRYASR